MLLDILKRARSYRRFDPSVPISMEMLQEWVAACRYCPSGRNIQALKYALVTDKEVCNRIFPLLAWAGYLKDWNGPQENERPTAYIVQLLDKGIAENCLCDDGLQLQTLVLSATEAGFGGCIIKSFKDSALREVLQLPEQLEITYVLALGKPAETVRIEDMQEGQVRYWRTPDKVHHVPKRSVSELIYRLFFLLVGFFCLFRVSASDTANYCPSPQNLAAREHFRDNKFGIFLHWGLYSITAQGEWYLNRGIDRNEYRKLAGAFYPAGFDAEEWVSAIKAAGARYICFTTRHHDGFSMWNTEFSDYNIVKATPFRRDVLKELADACHRQGIDLHLYYSHLDWDREDYYPLGRTGRNTGRTAHGSWDTYYAFMNNQLRELLTNYGKIGAIWFDGWWDHDQDSAFDWQLPGQYGMIHALQPSCLIGNNHHQQPFPGEDIQIFERDLPGENTAGLSGQEIASLPLETCQTMNGMWGYKIADQDYKDTRTLIHYLVRAAGKNANLLLNIGPQPDGRLPQTALERLAEIGEWLQTFGPTVYETRGGLIPPHPWGVVTKKENRCYVHILELSDRVLFVPLRNVKVKEAKEFASKKAVKFRQDKEGIYLTLDAVPQAIDHVVELVVESK